MCKKKQRKLQPIILENDKSHFPTQGRHWEAHYIHRAGTGTHPLLMTEISIGKTPRRNTIGTNFTPGRDLSPTMLFSTKTHQEISKFLFQNLKLQFLGGIQAF